MKLSLIFGQWKLKVLVEPTFIFVHHSDSFRHLIRSFQVRSTFYSFTSFENPHLATKNQIFILVSLWSGELPRSSNELNSYYILFLMCHDPKVDERCFCLWYRHHWWWWWKEEMNVTLFIFFNFVSLSVLSCWFPVWFSCSDRASTLFSFLRAMNVINVIVNIFRM